MRRKLPILSPLILLALVGAAGAGIIDPQEELVERVFPFEVGQEYQFKSSGPFILYDGPARSGITWPADSVAEVTITDTLIYGVSFLRIPFWNPFGEGYYRYDEGREAVLQAHPGYAQLVESVVVDLRLIDYPATQTQVTRLWHWAYPEELTAHIPFYDFYTGTPLGTGTVEIGGEAIERMKAYAWWGNPDWGADIYFGLGGPGWCQHGASRDSKPDSIAVWSLFRAKSDEPWPEFDPVLGPLALSVERDEANPTAMDIEVTAYPNPFNPSVTVRYSVPEAGDISVIIYNTQGRLVRELRSGWSAAGTHASTWDGQTDLGERAGNGVYFVRVKTGEGSAVERVTLVR